MKGVAACIPLKNLVIIPAGLKIRYRLSYVAMKNSLLEQLDFHEVLSTYLHELAHVFGEHRSTGFSNGLTEILDFVLKNTASIGNARAGWEKIQIDAVTHQQDGYDSTEGLH